MAIEEIVAAVVAKEVEKMEKTREEIMVVEAQEVDMVEIITEEIVAEEIVVVAVQEVDKVKDNIKKL